MAAVLTNRRSPGPRPGGWLLRTGPRLAREEHPFDRIVEQALRDYAGKAKQLLGVLVGLIFNQNRGGPAVLLQAILSQGLGESWVGGGVKQPINPSLLESVLGRAQNRIELTRVEVTERGRGGKRGLGHRFSLCSGLRRTRAGGNWSLQPLPSHGTRRPWPRLVIRAFAPT